MFIFKLLLKKNNPFKKKSRQTNKDKKDNSNKLCDILTVSV